MKLKIEIHVPKKKKDKVIKIHVEEVKTEFDYLRDKF